MRLAPIFAALLIAASTLCAFAEVRARFDGWIVVGSSGSSLIALMDDSATPLVAVSCSSSFGAYSFNVRVIDARDVVSDKESKPKYFRFLAWSDSGPASEYTAVVAPEAPVLGEVWVSPNPAVNEQPQNLWGMLKTSRVKFSYSTPSGVRSVKAGDLPTAVEYFEAACRSIMPKRP
jgi:hypothetical protein